MIRRDVLTILGTGTSIASGCMNTRILAARHPSGPRELVKASASVPESDTVSVSTKITQPVINSEQTARFTLTLTWHGKEPERLFFGNTVPFTEPQYSTSPKGLILFTAGSNGSRRQNQRTWLPKTNDNGGVPSRAVSVSRELAPGETLSSEWEVWGDPRHVYFIEPATYTFENTWGRESDKEPISWNLALTIQKKSSGSH